MRKKTEKNPKGCGRLGKFAKEHGKTKRISVSIPSKREKEIKVKFETILEPYLFNSTI